MWRIARKVAHDRVISTVDPETRHAHKSRSRKQDGFKAHIAAEPDTGLITNAMLTKATGPGTGDAAAGAVVLAGDDSFTGPVRMSWPIPRTAPVSCSPTCTKPDTTR